MKLFVKTILFSLLCFVLIIQLETIYGHIVNAYSNSINYLANNTTDSIIVLGF